MRDAETPIEADSQKFWFTNESDPKHLYEYLNKTMFRAGTPSYKYNLPEPFKVTLLLLRVRQLMLRMHRNLRLIVQP